METAQRIYNALAADSEKREHLGASIIGHPCSRHLFYAFRWAVTKKFDGKTQRLFRRGQIEEEYLVSDLRKANLIVRERHKKTGEQFRVSALGGHFGGSLDALIEGCPDQTVSGPIVAEFKTMNRNQYAKLEKEGCEKAQPKHYAQMQIYMHLSFPSQPKKKIKQAYYLVVRKDDDALYEDIFDLDEKFAEGILAKAEKIIFTDEPPLRIDNEKTFVTCKFCEFSDICHGDDEGVFKLPEPTCRTCVYGSPKKDGKARWHCNLKGEDLSHAAQIEGCEEHAFLPSLMEGWGQRGNVSDKDNWIEYTMPDGRTFKNGSRTIAVFSSKELHAFNPHLIGNPHIDKLRKNFGGTIESVKEDGYPFDDEIPF